MTTTTYNQFLHRVELCQACQGSGSRTLGEDFHVQCSSCMGLGLKVFLGVTHSIQITDPALAGDIIASFRQQYRLAEKLKAGLPAKKPAQQGPPPFNPWEAPNNPMNPRNPFGWTHPFSPNNPSWKNNPANPQSINHPLNPQNPNKKK